jgi:biopolymer transport protein ExbB
MGNMTLMELFKINPLIISVLFGCSILMLGCLFERLWAFSKVGQMDPVTSERVKQSIRQGQVKEAIAMCSRKRSFYTHALEVALNAAHFPREEMESIFALYRMKLQNILNKRMAIFGTLAFSGPLIGLLGTVMGVMRAFRDLAMSGSGGPSIVAAGIAEALVTTAGGIFVAVVSAVLYNMFTSFAKAKLQQYDQLSQEVAILVYTGNDKGAHR